MTVEIEGATIEGGATLLRSQLRDAVGTLLVQDDITSISYQVWWTRPPAAARQGSIGGWVKKYIDPGETPVKVTDTTTLLKADVILDTPGEWDLDDDGFNFKAVIPPEDFGTIDKASWPKSVWTRVDVEIEPAIGDVILVPFNVELKPKLHGK